VLWGATGLVLFVNTGLTAGRTLTDRGGGGAAAACAYMPKKNKRAAQIIPEWIKRLLNMCFSSNKIHRSVYASSGTLPGRRGPHESKALITRGLVPLPREGSCPCHARARALVTLGPVDIKVRHSGMLLAGIHLNQRLKIWIPANNMPE